MVQLKLVTYLPLGWFVDCMCLCVFNLLPIALVMMGLMMWKQTVQNMQRYLQIKRKLSRFECEILSVGYHVKFQRRIDYFQHFLDLISYYFGSYFMFYFSFDFNLQM